MEYASLAIVGAVVSVIVQFFKTSKILPGSAGVIGVSLVAGIVYWLVRDLSVWQSFLGILVVANTVYGLVIKRFESEN